MGGLTTLLQLRNAIYQQVNMSGSTGPAASVPPDELTRMVNASMGEFYDMLVQTNLQFNVTSSIFTMTGSQSTFDMKSLGVFKVDGVERSIDGQTTEASFKNVTKFAWPMRNIGTYPYGNLWPAGGAAIQYRWLPGVTQQILMFRPSIACSGVYRVWYYPLPPVLQADGDAGFEDTMYWDEYVVVDCAIKVRDKFGEDVSVLMARKEALKERIRTYASDMDMAECETIGGVHAVDGSYDGYSGVGARPWV
jgi:hypothetical protein